MLEMLRDKAQGVFTWAIFLIIIGAFAMWGLSDYFTPGGFFGGTAAKVNGEKISWQAVEDLYNRVQKQGDQETDSRSFKDQLRMALIQRTALLASAKELGFRVGDTQIAKLILRIPDFQEDGKFSKDRYQKVLAENAYTDQSFRKELSQDLLLEQFEQGLVHSNFALPKELNDIVGLFEQHRDFGYCRIAIKNFQKDNKISKEEAKAYFEKHRTNYVKPEEVSIEYVELSLNDLAKQVSVSDEQIKDYYTKYQSSYSIPDLVHARHILISIPENADQNRIQQAKEKADNIVKELKAGADFAKLAKKESADTGSAAEGGDLGWFGKGKMVAEFEKAAFALKKPKDLSEPTRTQFGFHIIQLLEKKDAQTRPYEEVKKLVEEQLRREEAQKTFAEKTELLAKFAFEQPSSLQPITDQLGLPVKKTEFFNRTNGQGVASNPSVNATAFSEEVLVKGNNSNVLPLSDSSSVVIRVKEHHPTVQQAFEDVQKTVESQLVAERALEKVKQLGETIKARLEKGEDPVKLAKQYNLSWTSKKNVKRGDDKTDRMILGLAFQLEPPMPGKAKVQGLAEPSGDYLLVSLNKVTPGDMNSLDEKTREAYHQSMIKVGSQMEFMLYAMDVLNKAKVEFSEQPK